MNKKSDQKELEENELVSWGEQKLIALKPYATQILLGCLIAFLAFMAITYFVTQRGERAAEQWRQLNNSTIDFSISGNTDRLRDVADLHPDGRAGYWALQMAGDFDLQTGLGQLANDREGGFKVIKRAKETLEKVVDGNDISPMLAQRSRFSLAYACESLGEFTEAKKHFQTLLDAYPESAFADAAKRAVVRVDNPKMSEAYTSFTAWEDIGEAPGPAAGLPDAPSLDTGAFEGLDVPTTQPNAGGGDLVPGGESSESGGDEAPMIEDNSTEPEGEKTTEPASAAKGEDDLPPSPKKSEEGETTTEGGEATEKGSESKDGDN